MNVAQRDWTTGVVLLSQLRAAFRLVEGDARFDYDDDDPLRVGMVTPSDDPIILGADDVFLEALEAGEVAVSAYLQDVFALRSNSAIKRLEETENG